VTAPHLWVQGCNLKPCWPSPDTASEDVVPCSWHSAGVLALSWGKHACGKKVSLAHAWGVQEGAGTDDCTGLARAKATYLRRWHTDYARGGGRVYSVGFALQMRDRAPVLETPQTDPFSPIPSREAEPQLQPKRQAQMHSPRAGSRHKDLPSPSWELISHA